MGELVQSIATERTQTIARLARGSTGKHRRFADLATLTGHAGSVHAVASSPDGRAPAAAGSDGRVHIWNAPTARPCVTDAY
ncbi:hypothetical protein [Nonomuraea sp. NBC_00507]|uniref:hypothetical protein n=1 Tax=Nonomuraea sp. NBC_00507 TaxID=2976002 RepID=UPI003FA55C0E